MVRGKNPEAKILTVWTSPDTPGRPTDFEAVEVTPRVVNVTWNLPRVTNGEIDHFNLEYSTLDNTKSYKKINVTGKFAVIEDLQVK